MLPMEELIRVSMPPGFGFHPTDTELISHYLKRKVLGHKVDFEVIQEVDIYKHEPWDLPAKCRVPSRDCQWHFFSSRDRKYPNGSRSNRATEAGYWKSTGKDRNVRLHNRTIGTKKTLVFHQGKPPYGKRTDWIMHEYYLNESEYKGSLGKDTYVLCRITKRNDLTKGDEKVVCAQAETSAYISLPSVKCRDEHDDSEHLMLKNEASSPVESMDGIDLDAWFMELFDPNFQIGDKVEQSSLDVSHLHEISSSNHIEMNVSTTGGHGRDHQVYDFQDNYNLAELPSVGKVEPLSGRGHPLSLSNAAEWAKDEDLLQLPASMHELLANDRGIIPENDQERNPSLVPNTFGHHSYTETETGIQIRERKYGTLNAPSSHQHRILLHVHKMESRNPRTIDQTFIFVSENSYLDSSCEFTEHSDPPVTRADLAASRSTVNPHKARPKPQERPVCGNSSSKIPQPSTKSHGRSTGDRKSEDLTSKSDKLGSVCVSVLSKLRHRKPVQYCNLSEISQEPREIKREACGRPKGIRTLLQKCSSAGLNCMLLASCMVGAATLCSLFMVKDARRYMCSFHVF